MGGGGAGGLHNTVCRESQDITHLERWKPIALERWTSIALEHWTSIVLEYWTSVLELQKTIGLEQTTSVGLDLVGGPAAPSPSPIWLGPGCVCVCVCVCVCGGGVAPYYRGRPVWVCKWVREAAPMLQRMTLVVSAPAPSVYATLT